MQLITAFSVYTGPFTFPIEQCQPVDGWFQDAWLVLVLLCGLDGMAASDMKCLPKFPQWGLGWGPLPRVFCVFLHKEFEIFLFVVTTIIFSGHLYSQWSVSCLPDLCVCALIFLIEV